MPSPSPDCEVMETASPDVCDLLDAVLEQDSPPGMKTTLYPYQKVMGIL